MAERTNEQAMHDREVGNDVVAVLVGHKFLDDDNDTVVFAEST